MKRAELPIAWTLFAGLTLALVAGLSAGCRPGDHPPDGPPGKVADWLIDLLYLEVRQAQAIEGTIEAARARIEAEQKAVAEVRGGRSAMAARQEQVYWERTAETAAPEPTFTYELTFTAAGLRILKEVHLALKEARPGVWRVYAITERDLPPPPRDP